ncbi:DUF3857 domain-containing protein [Algoriphagus sp.]|uniref:DUF3857 domain-containing protein n=1 Tax=Algoriphagus sp. TaxID=1872435 RepID=UPI0026383F64|nr:DUF3857 domain-containing protein [Algoriphagus sp.]
MISSSILGLIFLILPDLSDTLSTDTVPAFHSKIKEKKTIILEEDFSYTEKVEKEIQVLSEEGLSHAFTSLQYDNLSEIVDFYLEVRDPSTKKVLEKAKLKDMTDAAIYSTTNIFDDNRHKYYRIYSGKFPIEVQIRYETRMNTNFYFRDWIPVHRYFQKVEKSELEVIYPQTLGFRFKEINLTGEKKEEKLPEGKIRLHWIEKNLPVQGTDFKSEEDHKILMAPSRFSVAGIQGTMEDWSGLAAWQHELNRNRDKLPKEFEKKVLSMIEGMDDTYQQVSVLYDYLQQNFRYVSIQLGIGGWQTMSASETIKHAYGDCKGLTNLMKSMLQIAGIPSNYTLVFAGKDADDIEIDLPSIQFNHVILQVPTDQDPIWLECTSNQLPAGYLGSFTSNRHVLVTQEGGGYLTKTPDYSADQWNQIKSITKLELDEQGNAKISSNRKLNGNFAQEVMEVKKYLDHREQRDYFHRNSPVSGLIVSDYELSITKIDSLPIAQLTYHGYVQRFAQSTAKRMILRPFLGNITEDMLIHRNLDLEESYSITLPSDLSFEGTLENIYLQEDQFEVNLSYQLSDRLLQVTRTVKISFPDNVEKEQLESMLKKVNQFGHNSFYFTKPTTSIH